MGVNGYQGQICAADQPNGYFAANEEILNLIQNLASVQVDYLERIGIEAPPGTEIKINNQEHLFQIGKTGFYEVDDVIIQSLKFPINSPKNVIIDFIIKRAV